MNLSHWGMWCSIGVLFTYRNLFILQQQKCYSFTPRYCKNTLKKLTKVALYKSAMERSFNTEFPVTKINTPDVTTIWLQSTVNKYLHVLFSTSINVGENHMEIWHIRNYVQFYIHMNLWIKSGSLELLI